MAHHVHVRVHIGNHRSSRSGGAKTSTHRRRAVKRSRRRRGTYAGAPAGSGKNFAALKHDLSWRGVRNPGALAAWIGRRKYTNARFARMAARGRRRGRSRSRR